MSRSTTRTARTGATRTAHLTGTTGSTGSTGSTGGRSSGRHALLRPLALLVAVPLVLAGCSSDGDGGSVGGPTPDDTAPAPSVDPAVTAAPEEALAPFYSQELTWVGCETVDPPEGVTGQDHECTTMEVPLDYAAPGEGTILLSLVRLPAAGQDRIGSLVLNPGGPGGSGVDYALGAALATTEAVREVYDVVGFDPRGVARSAGVECLDDSTYAQFLSVDQSPDDDAELAELQRLSTALAEGCADDRAAPFADTVSATRDMDVLRAVLGDADLNFLGKSYGTVLGAMYAELFPDRVGRFVLDGAVDLTPRAADDPQRTVEQAQGFELALESFVADCLTRSDCPLSGGVDDGVAQVRGFLAGLDAAPLPTGDEERPLTQGLGVLSVLYPLYQYDAWPALRAGLTGGLAGDGEVLLFLTDIFTERQEDGSYRGNTGEAIYAVNCLDGGSDPEGAEAITLEDLDELSDLLAEQAPTFGPSVAYGGLPCLEWPFEPVAWPEIDGEGAPEILVIGTTRDPATPVVWAERLAEQLVSGVLVTYDGDGHTAYAQTGAACVDEVVDAFLVEGTVPVDGLVCVAEY